MIPKTGGQGEVNRTICLLANPEVRIVKYFIFSMFLMTKNSAKIVTLIVIAEDLWKLLIVFLWNTKNKKTEVLQNFPKKMLIMAQVLNGLLLQLKQNKMYLQHLFFLQL